MKVKVSEATERQLDWMVAKIEGISLLDAHNNKWELCWTLLGDNSGNYYTPTTDWAQGGPIIERENIALYPHGDGTYEAEVFLNPKRGAGPTPLIAAMRCFVASKLGETVEVPEELCTPST